MPLSRRQLLHSAAIAPALGALAAFSSRATAHQLAKPAEPPAQPRKRTLRKAAMIGMVGDGETLRDKFQLLRDCGFEGVEVDSPSKVEQQEVLDAAAATGLIVHGVVNSVHWKLPLNHPSDRIREQAMQGLDICLRDAAAFGASSILLVPGLVNDDMPYDECYRISQEQIRAALPLARELKVVIAVENVWNGFLLSPLEAARYVDEFDDPLLRFHFDIGNVINFGRPAQWIRILGTRITKLHIKDFHLKNRDEKGLWKGFDVELGEGNADWPAVMRELDAIGYSTATDAGGKGNWATAEVRGGDRARLTQISEQMDRLFAM
jgi:hexulose-6-phosphate isomerase